MMIQSKSKRSNVFGSAFFQGVAKFSIERALVPPSPHALLMKFFMFEKLFFTFAQFSFELEYAFKDYFQFCCLIA